MIKMELAACTVLKHVNVSTVMPFHYWISPILAHDTTQPLQPETLHPICF